MKYLYTLLILQISMSIYSQNSVQKEIDRIATQPFYKHAQLGISVRNVTDGTLLVNVAKDKMFVPASTLKLVTTLIAKKKLGDNIVCAFIDLCLEIIYFFQPVWCFRMTFRKSCNWSLMTSRRKFSSNGAKNSCA